MRPTPTLTQLRLQAFERLGQHPWLSRVYNKLKPAELQLAREFIIAQGEASKGAFELAVNRLFLGGVEKPKNWTRILELLTCANSSLS